MAEDNKTQYQVSFDEGVSKSGTYANVVSVHVNGNEVVLDFGYLLPNSKPQAISVNSRVNMSHGTAKQFMTMLQNAMLDFDNKNKN